MQPKQNDSRGRRARNLAAMVVCIALSIWILVGPIGAQERTVQPASTLAADEVSAMLSSQLLAYRDQLVRQVASITEQLSKSRFDLQRFEMLDSDLQFARRDVEQSQRSNDPDAISRARARQESIEADLKQRPQRELAARQAVTDLELQLRRAQETLTRAEGEMLRRIDLTAPQQAFKLWMSLLFAMLVATVIVGFFGVAWRDEGVRRNVFSGQAGLQFITLFSLVIAIILFGIIGVLESRELAALLGGMSGYILGRTTSQRETDTSRSVSATMGTGTPQGA